MKVKLAALLVIATTGFAVAGPKIVTDIPPVHSLVSGVMGDVGAPELILRPGASPHGYAMAPSKARALAAADVVFWVSPALTPWLARAIDNLATDAKSVALVKADELRLLPFREGALFEAHNHDEHDDHGEENEEGHSDRANDEDHEEHGHDDHAKDGHHEDEHTDDEHGHEAGATDPHIWLDPRNAQAMTRAIVAALSAADPANAAIYAANGAALVNDLKGLEATLATTLQGARGHPFIVFHDAYHYFEARFDIEASGAISVSDATKPGPARLTEIKAAIGAFDAPCIFTEPQFPETHARLVMEGANAKLAVLDPMGAALTLGAGHYQELMLGMANSMAGCLAE